MCANFGFAALGRTCAAARPHATLMCRPSPERAVQAKPTWRNLVARGEPLLLPCAHDALAARLIERAGFAAYSIGGVWLGGSPYGIPDIGLAAFSEISAGIRDIMAAARLPVLVDGDTGYGDVKNVTHTIEGYEALGAS